MRVLLDESLPRRLSREFTEHEVRTVVDAGWSGIKNGKLMALAAAHFDVFITADQNLQYQQNLAALPVSVIVLVAHDNRLETLLPLVSQIHACLATLESNTLVRIGA